jgi:phospholipid/cholesterol/gamma-HCH transport system permease protein
VGWLDHFGSLIVRGLDDLGRFFYIMASSVMWTFRRPFDGAELMRQMVRVGWDSIPVVFLTCLFTGMVLALQTYRGFERFHAEGFVGSVVALSLTRELAPVLTGLMVAGRVGSAMSAELGTMRVTEQIDALYAMATEPIHYLVVPRVNASILMLPILTLVGDATTSHRGSSRPPSSGSRCRSRDAPRASTPRVVRKGSGDRPRRRWSRRASISSCPTSS